MVMAVGIKKTVSGIIAGVLFSGFLYSCSTAPARVPEQALVKLPEKRIVDLQEVPVSKIKKAKKAKNRELKTELKLIVPSVSPLWRPPVVARVLILPYIDRDNVLHGGQFAFVELKKGGWLFGRYLFRKPDMLFNPLNTASAFTNTKRFVARPPSPSTGQAQKNGSFFAGGKPNLPSSEGQFTYPSQKKGPSAGYQKQFNMAVGTVKR